MTPVEVFAAHRLKWYDRTCTGCIWRCPPGVDFEHAHAAHVLDALTKAGHVVVTLPEAETNEYGDEFFRVAGADSNFRDGRTQIEDDGRIHSVCVANPCRSPEQARRFAAALLAAAAAGM